MGEPMSPELTYVIRVGSALFVTLLALANLIRHRAGDSVWFVIIWMVLLVYGCYSLTWSIFDTIQAWDRIAG